MNIEILLNFEKSRSLKGDGQGHWGYTCI